MDLKLGDMDRLLFVLYRQDSIIVSINMMKLTKEMYLIWIGHIIWSVSVPVPISIQRVGWVHGQ